MPQPHLCDAMGMLCCCPSWPRSASGPPLLQPLVNRSIFSLLCADPFSVLLCTLLLGRAAVPVTLALYLRSVWVVSAVLRAFKHNSVASFTCKAHHEVVGHVKKTFNRGVVSFGDRSDCSVSC